MLPNQRLALYEPVLNTDLAVITKHTIKYFDTTNKIKPELSGFTKLLKENGIPFRRITRDSSNIFVKRIYVLVPPENLAVAKEMAKEYQEMDGIRYFYAL